MEKFKDALLGLVVGDAIGVPVEFSSRTLLKANPVCEMREFGTYNQPRGTWSDDSSLTLCLTESLCTSYDLNDIARKFCAWLYKNHWTAHNEVFDVGITTRNSIERLKKLLDAKTIITPIPAEEANEREIGNGALMRIIPLIFYTNNLGVEEKFRIVSEVSRLTHAHIRSVVACFIYIIYAQKLLQGLNKADSYNCLIQEAPKLLRKMNIPSIEIHKFDNIFSGKIATFKENEISSSGYAIHSLEASLWCLLNTSNYKDCVLTAVNLGSDTDTTAAIVGALAGIVYGIGDIPQEWLNAIARKKDIEKLADNFIKSIINQKQ